MRLGIIITNLGRDEKMFFDVDDLKTEDLD